MFQPKKITEHIYGQDIWKGCNSTLVTTSEGVVLLDVPPEIEKAKIWKEFAESLGPIKYIVNTECHHDHWITNSVFGDAVVITHAKTYKMMVGQTNKFIRERIKFLYQEPFDYPDEFYRKLPDVIFDGSRLDIHLGGKTIQLLHVPGHTPGQLAVYIPEEKAVYTSDSVQNGTRTPYHDATFEKEWLYSLELINALDFDYLIPGHGEITCVGKPGGREFIPHITDLVRKVLALKEAGRFEGKIIPVELNREIDPLYDTSPRGLYKAGAPMLTATDECVVSGNHGFYDTTVPQKDCN